MDRMLVYAKTPAGEEATRQRTRVVQRNLRMVLLQVDGQLNVDGLVAKIGNESLVFSALRELEKGGYIALSADAPSVWEQSKVKVKKIGAAAAQISQFSAFGQSKAEPLDNDSFEPSVFSESASLSTKKAHKKVEPAISVASTAESVAPAPAPVASHKLPPLKPLPPGNWVKPKGSLERLQEMLAGLTSGFKTSPKTSSKAEKSVSGDLAPYKHKSWPLRIAGILAALVVVGFLIVFMYPYNSHRAAIESTLGAMIGVPVRIGSVGSQLLPRPSLTLNNVRIGEGEDLQIGTIVVPQLLSLYGSGRKVIPEVDVNDVVVQADFLTNLPRFFSGVHSSQNLVVEHVRFSGVSLAAADLVLKDMVGELSLKSGNQADELLLATPNRALQFKFAPIQAGIEVVVQSAGWKPAENSPYEFSLIAAKGLLQRGKLDLNNTEFRVAEGSFKGGWTFEWGKGSFSTAANGEVSSMEVRGLTKIFALPLEMDGRLSGNVILAGAGNNWWSMWQATEATMSMRVDRGVINGVVRGGLTKFDSMKADLVINARQVSGKNVQIDSGMVTANGQFLAGSDKSVEAEMQMKIQGTAAPIRSVLRVYGKLPVLQTVMEK